MDADVILAVLTHICVGRHSATSDIKTNKSIGDRCRGYIKHTPLYVEQHVHYRVRQNKISQRKNHNIHITQYL